MKLAHIFLIFFLTANVATFGTDFEDDFLSFQNDPDILNLQDLPDDFTNMSVPTRSFTPSDALAALISANVPAILANDLYLRTNPLNNRQLTTLPVFLLFHTNYQEYCSLFRFYLFYNQTSKMFYTKRCPFLKGYLALTNDNLLDEILNNEVTDLTDFTDFLALFQDVKIEQRRAGTIFQWLKNWNKTSLEIDLPFLYQERNLILTNAEIEDIKSSNLVAGFGDSNVEDDKQRNKDIEKAITKNVVADLLGFSDLKIKLGHQIINLPYKSIKLGFELYLPTAFAIKKGMIGSNFSKDTERPGVDIVKLMDLVFNDKIEEAKAIGAEIAKAAGNRFAAMTLQSELGDNKHLSAAVFAEGRFQISEIFHINTYGNLKYTFPVTETRYYIQAKNYPCSCFNTQKYQDDLDTGNEALIECDVNFLQEQAINTLFPDAIKTVVSPGISGEFTFAPHVRYKGWNVVLGVDIWATQKEKVDPKNINLSCYRIGISKKSSAYQTRIFSRLYKELEKEKFDFAVGLQGDYCVDSVGIGQDFTFALSFEFNF